jgi:DNA repair photolyase
MRERETANPANRFARTVVDYEPGDGPPPSTVTLLEDHSRSILSHNDSPDLGFSWSANPYRGCIHACAYCYARPSHEYLDMGAGTDFDTKIVYKPKAAELLRAAFDAVKWKGELVMFSGVTDCYQPFEATLQLTRACLEVCLEYRNPVSVISKSALIERDIDLFAELAAVAGCHVTVSLAFNDAEAARAIEPWAPSPARRLKVIEAMARAGVPVGIMVAPIIPMLNDRDLPLLLERARDAGATSAGWTLLRLPGAVAPVFEERVREAMPLAATRIMNRIRETRSGRIYDSRFHLRGRGEGPYAETIGALFAATMARLGLGGRHHDEEDERPTTFRRPDRPKGPQLALPLFDPSEV